MLRVNPRERPTAIQALGLPELQEKILSFQAIQKSRPEFENMLLNTIKVPQALRKLNEVLPKPCYPEVSSLPKPPPVPIESCNDAPKEPRDVSPRPTPRVPLPPSKPLAPNPRLHHFYR